MPLKTDDLRIREIKEVISPAQLHQELPLTDRASQTVVYARRAIQKVLAGEDERLLLVTGPCSIHDPEAAREYAGCLKGLMTELAEDLLILMRVYFEKPRTTVGWKGLINDPGLNGSFRINDGLRIARRLLLDLGEMGVPAGTEYLDPISPQYIADLISWGTIGARTTESQIHREMASGLSCPIGFKNATDGSLNIAIDAMISARHPHHFLGVTKEGHSAIFSTSGNPDCHIILRGGSRPNYDTASIDSAARLMQKARLQPRLVIDCSHANSEKDHKKQVEVCRAVANQIATGDKRILGVMLESHLVPGRQDLVAGRPLTYGQSITDACMGWEETGQLIRELAAAARTRGKRTSSGRELSERTVTVSTPKG